MELDKARQQRLIRVHVGEQLAERAAGPDTLSPHVGRVHVVRGKPEIAVPLWCLSVSRRGEEKRGEEKRGEEKREEMHKGELAQGQSEVAPCNDEGTTVH